MIRTYVLYIYIYAIPGHSAGKASPGIQEVVSLVPGSLREEDVGKHADTGLPSLQGLVHREGEADGMRDGTTAKCVNVCTYM